MKEGLLQLLKLQEVDKELHSLEEVKEKYPIEILERQNLIERSGAKLQEQQDTLEELDKHQRHYERELRAAQEDLKAHEARFAEVTNNREYDALQLETEACKTKMSECETQILESIDRANQVREQIEAISEEHEEVRKEQQDYIDQLQEKLDSLQTEADGVNERRQSVSQGIEAPLLKMYERGNKKSKSARVAALRKGACGGCFRELPAQQKSLVRRNDQLHFCESCGAIMVWDEQSS